MLFPTDITTIVSSPHSMKVKFTKEKKKKKNEATWNSPPKSKVSDSKPDTEAHISCTKQLTKLMSWNMPVNFHLSWNGLWPHDTFREYAHHFYNNSVFAFPRVSKRDGVEPLQLRKKYIIIDEFSIQRKSKQPSNGRSLPFNQYWLLKDKKLLRDVA